MVDRLVNSEANNRRIGQVEACFGASGQPLSQPGRVLVGEGVLTKLCRKKPKPRQFFLFNDVLVYGNIVINKKKYNKQHLLPLEDVRLKPVEDDGNLKNGWQIISTTKSFTVYAATATEKSEWMAHINKCISDLLAKSGKTPATNLSPVWIPDAEAPICMSCQKTKFTPINRRHHCRKCGNVVCGGCSAKKYLLPSQSNKAVRVCDACYDQLSATRGRLEPTRDPSYGTTGPAVDQDSYSESDEDDDEEEEHAGNSHPDENEHPTFYEENYS